ncbi:ABC transporter ATP-binding protein [Virgibacillus sp. W0181]|uniref:ABC transporter ATP-binding protein n=1 Tax=Virgibacillus sp. W0181 TaxID=3391581 RepID=UPI003F476B6F
MKMVIDMKNVSWKRTGKTILTDINWQVEKGQHWAVLGLNGSGKTSLLNMVNGYIWPTTGTVSVLGERFGKTDIRELRKSIGWVSSSMQERINGRHVVEDIIVSGKFASVGLDHLEPVKNDYERVYQLMEQLGCKHLYNQTYDKCSNGEKQKVLIARGLMPAPKLLILDEPTSGLDFIAREELMNSLQELAETNDAPTIIFVTHHIEEVLPFFSHTLLVKRGTVFDQGQRKETLTGDNLSAFFEKSIHVEWHKNRAWMNLV